MHHDVNELETRVNRKYKPLMRVIWSGFIAAVIWVLLIIGLIIGAVSFELFITAGFLSLLLPATAGILFAQGMIKVGMMEEEEKRMAELGLLEKRKHREPDTVRLSDDGELIDYDDYYDEDPQSQHTAEY